MKKTIIAAAVSAVVAMPAMADVSVSGNIYVETGEQGKVSKTENFYDLFVKTSEDLGNGMKVSTVMQLEKDNGSVSTGGETSATLSGDFGSIKAGQFETYAENQILAMAATDPSHRVSVEITDGNDGDERNGIRYTSPTVSGLTIGAETFENDGVSSGFIQYSNGGLTVKAAREGQTSAVDSIDSLAVEYKMDGLTARVVTTDNGTGSDQTFFGATYTMGANTIGFGVVDGTSGATGAPEDGDYTISLQHAMSKSTSVYIAMQEDDNADTNDKTIVGLVTKF